MFCEKCGKQVIENADFCPYCGQKLNKEGARPHQGDSHAHHEHHPAPEESRGPHGRPEEKPHHEAHGKPHGKPHGHHQEHEHRRERHYGSQIGGFIFALVAASCALMLPFLALELAGFYVAIPIVVVSVVALVMAVGRGKHSGFSHAALALSIIAIVIALLFIFGVLFDKNLLNLKFISEKLNAISL